MLVKTLSVKQPYAALICAGVKTVENRTWKTEYRGRLLIHASGDSYSWPDFTSLPEKIRSEINERFDNEDFEAESQAMLKYEDLIRMAFEFYGQDWEQQEPPENWLRQAVKEKGFFLEAQAIVGECVLSDIVTGSTDDFAEPDCYHWILTDPLFYRGAEIHRSVLGHLRLWEYDIA